MEFYAFDESAVTREYGEGFEVVEHSSYVVAIEQTTSAERALVALVATTDLRAAPPHVQEQVRAVLQAPSEMECLRAALIGGDPLDPRWTWLGGVIERLEEHAPADEDPDAMHEGARVLQAIYDDLRKVLGA